MNQNQERETLKDVWESMGFTPTQLAAQLGISTQTLYRMSKGEKVRQDTVITLCRSLQITPEYYYSLLPLPGEKND